MVKFISGDRMTQGTSYTREDLEYLLAVRSIPGEHIRFVDGEMFLDGRLRTILETGDQFRYRGVNRLESQVAAAIDLEKKKVNSLMEANKQLVGNPGYQDEADQISAQIKELESHYAFLLKFPS